MANIGFATLSVIPSFSGFQSRLATGMAAPIAAAGTKAGAQAGTNASKGFASKFQSGIGGLSTKLFAGLGIAALGKQVIGVQADFESSMNVLAESADVPAGKMNQLSDFAKQMGQNTVFSAGEAADAMVELAKAGLSPAQIQAGALKSTMAVAATEGLGLADSATIVSNAMTTFKLKGSQAAEVADALAGGSKASTASVASLSEALRQVGGSAVDSGLSLQETVGALSAFDQEGLKGSDAGTSLKTMLSRLVPQTDKARSAMESLGLQFTNSNGTFLPLAQVAEQLQNKLGPLSDAERTLALNTIFGSDARRGAIALMHQGAEGITKFTEATSEAGTAQRLATARMKGTAGAIEQMKGAIENAELALGETLAPTVTATADGISSLAGTTAKLVDGFGSLPGPVKNFGLALAGLKLASFFGLNPSTWASRTGGAFDNVKTRVQLAGDAYRESRTQVVRFGDSAVNVASTTGRLKASVSGLSTAFMGAGSSLKRGLGSAVSAIGGPWTIAIAAGTAALAYFANKQADAAAEANELRDSLNQQTGAVTRNAREWAANKLADDNLVDNVRQLGLNAADVTSAMLDQGDSAARLSRHLQEVVDAATRRNRVDGTVYYTSRGQAAKDLLDVINDTNGSLQDQRDRIKFVTAAKRGDASATQGAAQAESNYQGWVDEAADAVNRQRDAILSLIDAHNKQADAATQNRRDQVGLEQAFADAAAEARKGTKTLNDQTDAGRKNWNALLDLADQWNASSDQVRNARGAYKGMRQTFIDVAVEMGASDKKAKQLADRLLSLPKRRNLNVNVDGIDEAQDDLDALERRLQRMQKDWRMRVTVDRPKNLRGPGITTGMATGGKVGGTGTDTSDSNLLYGSRGEWMIRAKAARHYGDAFMSALNNMQLPKMAGGGAIGGGGGGVNFNGPITVVAHDYGDFMRQMNHRARKVNSGGSKF